MIGLDRIDPSRSRSPAPFGGCSRRLDREIESTELQLWLGRIDYVEQLLGDLDESRLRARIES
jgi:hypothetical protein